MVVGWLLFFWLYHALCIYLFQRGLVNKANTAPGSGSNVEFILGKPYVILTEKEYVSLILNKTETTPQAR